VLADSPNWWEGQFRYDIRTADERWTEVEIPLSDFEFHSFNSGYPEPTGAMMRRPDRKALVHIELMSELFVDGEFRLEVDEISFNTL